ncbi:hypothetical protein [Methylobacterium oxalidis]|uniref:hypothetical protein n=1 Tax=Methylobacterium oxalidis TaxID=944322 RepID=UPI0011BFCFE6|nr:hypothetical protein [Methylobacterium oxalidis]
MTHVKARPCDLSSSGETRAAFALQRPMRSRGVGLLMIQNDPATVLNRDSDLILPAILAATAVLAVFTAISAVVLGFEIAALFEH